MNRFRIKTDLGIEAHGGLKIKLNDFCWIDESVREVLYGIISAFGVLPADSFKLSGCVVTITSPDNYACTAGYVCHKGEVYKVDAHTFAAVGISGDPIAFLDIDITNDANGYRAFDDMTMHDTYEIRKMKLACLDDLNPAIADKMAITAPYLDEVIINKIAAKDSGWQNVVFEGDWFNSGGTYATCQYKKDAFGVVTLRGFAEVTTPAAGTIFTLPVGFAPNKDEMFVFASTGDPGFLKVSADGTVSVFSGPQNYVSLSGINFKTV